MNDELIYALVALGIHWYSGYWGTKKLYRSMRHWDGANEFLSIFGVLILGIIMIPWALLLERWETKGSWFE